MNIEYLTAKNGEKTISLNGIFFHSSYNPSKEAERFVQSLNIPYKAESIILIEPGLPYLKKYLKERFPDSKIICIRLINGINSSDWDFSVEYKNQQQLETYFSYNFDESKLLKTTMISWPLTQKIFPKENDEIWKSYKKVLNTAKTLLVTRQYFEKRWLYNSCCFFSFIKKTVIIKEKNNFPVVITASGPSLKKTIPLLKILKNKFLLLAVSSSLSPLLKNNIIPDIVISTDGGYWAGEHLKNLLRKHSDIPLAISSEAYSQREILKNNPIIPLSYKDGLSNQFFEKTNITNMTAERNGTVSGTALNFAESISSGKIYFCGLDLAISKGLQHSQPNELEINNSLNDYRIQNKETRNFKSELNSASLEIYLKWFSDYNFKNPTYRIIEKPANSIKGMTDIGSEEFKNIFNSLKDIKKDFLEKEHIITEEKRLEIKEILKKLINSNINTEKWKEELFPIDYVSISHAENINDKNFLIKNLDEKIEKVKTRLQAAIDE
ncbi:MAG: DUF115 domain-containing protein [Treponema sp.]|nr:DUF115 domain-containing protein [Treponema sp.]